MGKTKAEEIIFSVNNDSAIAVPVCKTLIAIYEGQTNCCQTYMTGTVKCSQYDFESETWIYEDVDLNDFAKCFSMDTITKENALFNVPLFKELLNEFKQMIEEEEKNPQQYRQKYNKAFANTSIW